MPTELGDPFDISWRGTPEQMLEQDIPLWYQFVDKHGPEFMRFFYNVRVGGPDISKIKEDEKTAKLWYTVTAKRIDVLAEKKDLLWIIEVTSIPGLRAVGQCLTYNFLWNQDPKIKKPTLMVLLCQRIDADLEAVLNHHRIGIVKMEPPQKPPK